MRAKPLTVLTPIPWWWALWTHFSWKLIEVFRASRLVTRPLRRLSFIHFARWSVIGRWPPDRQARRDRAAPRSLLFLTSFDGSDIQYIEAFVRVVPWRINGLYGGAKGFPGPRRFGPVERYIYDHSHPVDHFWMSHPEASTTMVAQALKLKEAFDAFEPRVADADGERFGREWRRFLTEVQDLL
jgi:hypothetical protein